jgi:hypothetical protein
MRLQEKLTPVIFLLLQTFLAPGNGQADGTPCTQRVGAQRVKQVNRKQLTDHTLWLSTISTSSTISTESVKGKRLDLSCTVVEDADLSGLNLSLANLSQAKLVRVNLSFANLSGANLSAAELVDPVLSGANLDNAELMDAVLKGAKLNNASLRGASLIHTQLSGAILFEADLSGAILDNASFDGAELVGARLEGASLAEADFCCGVVFEPETLPLPKDMATAHNLERLTYKENPLALTQLRKQFADGGFGEKERQIIYALNRRSAELDLRLGWLRRILFDLPCQYGMSPGRALWILLSLWAVSSLIYATVLLLSPEVDAHKWPRALYMALLFSTMCAFRLGFREFDPGNWIQMLMRKPYRMEGAGWVRTAAGTQSLLSLYLLVLAILSYFGHPFAG